MKRHIKNCVFLHCSASDDPNLTKEEITRWHKARGFRDIGYHVIIWKDGSYEYGRDFHDSAAGALPTKPKGKNYWNDHNSEGIHIMLHGLKKENFTEEQFDTCASVINELKKYHDILDVVGHRVVSSKSCPVFDSFEIYKRL